MHRFLAQLHIAALLSAPIAVQAADSSVAELEQAVRDHVSQFVANLPLSNDAARVTIEVQPLDSRLRLAECFAPLKMTSGDFQGYGRLNVRVSCRTPRPWVVYVPANVKVYRSAVVAAVPIARGRVISAQDLTMAETNILDTGGRHMEQPDFAIGMQARRGIAVGKLVTEKQLQAPMLIHRGDEVRVVARYGEVAVLVSGTAMSDGRQGEQIRVRNQQSERVIRARVVGPGEVEAVL